MVTRTEKAYKNPRATMADGRLTGQARNISAPMRQGGVMQAAAEARRHRGAPPVPYTRPPVSTRQRAETALTRGVEQAGPGAIANAAVARIRGEGQAPGQARTALPRMPSAPAPEFESMYARSGQQPGMKPGGGEEDTNIYAEYQKMKEAGTAGEWSQESIAQAAGWGATPRPSEDAAPMYDDDGNLTGWTTGEAHFETEAPFAAAVKKAGVAAKRATYDIDGNVTGFVGVDGTVYDMNGNPISPIGGNISEDEWGPEAGMYESEKPKTKEQIIDEYMADDSPGIDPEDMFGQMYGMEQAEAQAGTNLASMMGGLGMGRSGQHMQAQTALTAQRFADQGKLILDTSIANLNAKQEKIKNIIAMQGQEMTLDQQRELHDELVALQKDADKFSVAEWLLALTQKDQFSQEGMARYFEMWDQGLGTHEIMAKLKEEGHLTEDAQPPPPQNAPLMDQNEPGGHWSSDPVYEKHEHPQGTGMAYTNHPHPHYGSNKPIA